MSEKLSVEIVSYKPMERNSLRGFVTVRIPALRLKIIDCTVNDSNGRRWIGLPGKAQINRDGEVIKKDGKAQYTPTCLFDSKEVGDAFGAKVLDALDAYVSDADAA